MTPAAFSSSSESFIQTDSEHCAQCSSNQDSADVRHSLLPPVGIGRRVATQGLTDEEREAAIVLAGKSVEHHMAEHKKALYDYDVTNSLLDKADADRHRLMAEEAARCMADLIKGRNTGGQA